MGSTSTNALLSFPARLHGPLLEALQQKRSSEKKSSSSDDDNALACSLDRATGATTVLARRALSRDSDLFLFEPLFIGTRSRLARAAVGDEKARSVMSEVVAEALMARIEGSRSGSGEAGEDAPLSLPPSLAPLPPFSGSETSDPLLNHLWGWLLPAGVGIDAGGSGRADARWALPPREVAWVQQHSQNRTPNARVSLLTLDDDDSDDEEDDGKRGESNGNEKKKEEEKLLLVLWLEQSVARGESLTLDWTFEAPGSSAASSSPSVCGAASLVARLREGRWAEGAEGRGRLSAAVEAAAAAAGPPAGGGGGAAERERQRQAQQAQRQRQQQQNPPPLSDDDERDFLVWSDYPVFSEWLDALEEGEEGGGGAEGEEAGRAPSSLLGHFPRRHRRLRRTRERSAADLVLSRVPLRSFDTGDGTPKQQLCNQFPFEGALVRKDLLPSTARSAFSSRCSGESSDCGENAAAAAAAVCWPASPDGGLHPPWFPPAYDLSTELHYLLREIQKEEEEKEEKGKKPRRLPSWIIKPAAATRSLGLAVSASAATLAAFALRAAAGGDRVAQRYVERPVLTRTGRKFDLRLCVVVRSFGGGGGEGGGEVETGLSSSLPPRASLYLGFHARVAPRRYCPPREGSRGLISQAVFGTVAFYNEGDGEEEEKEEEEGEEEEEDGAATRDPCLPRAAVDELLRSRGHDPRAVAAALASLARKVVEAGAGVIGGPWPRSRAVYGLDVVLDESEETRVDFDETEAGRREGRGGRGGKVEEEKAAASVLVPTPRLLEVNFAPDLATAARFNPDFPGLLLREMLREEEGEEEDDDEGMFMRLF